MGYTTTFQGEFRCHRAEHPQLAVFLKAVREGEATAMNPLADWLIDQGDARGEELSRLLASGDADPAEFWRLFGLRLEHAVYLEKFSRTRRMKRNPDRLARMADPFRKAVGLPVGPEGAYFVGGGGLTGQGRDESILDYNTPPMGQPGLWCKWVPNLDHTAIVWDGGEKFYDYVKWLEDLVGHFLAPWGYVMNGQVAWQGEREQDKGLLVVTDKKVKAIAEG